MLHPVGPLRAAVYWRRRLVLLAVLLALLGGAGGLVVLLDAGDGAAPGNAGRSEGPAPTPALERVLPSLAGVRTPEPAPVPATSPSPSRPAPRTTPAPAAGPLPCGNDAVEVAVRAPAEVPAGSKPTLVVVVRNVGSVPCVRSVDAELQEIVLVDAAGARVWGSNDCFPEQSDRRVTLRPGAEVTLPVVWGGLTSTPGCTGERTVPPAGDYALRARQDTETSAEVPLRLG